MACDAWTEKLDAYLDGELSADQSRLLYDHLRSCSGCGADAVAKLQQKRAIQGAAQKFAPDPAFRARIQSSSAVRKRSSWTGYWMPILATTAAALLIAGALVLNSQRGRRGEEQLASELIDQHVATLASANPVDVISTDRHTVKPWFEGKIPFTFNLPELQGSEFALIGGKVSYLSQSPGAELIFRVRQHQISVFIFQERELGEPRGNEAMQTTLSFNVRSWSQNGLRYFAISDTSPQDVDKLIDLMKAAR